MIPESIKKLAQKVRTEIYGRDVRESIAQSMEVSGETSNEANERSKDTATRQTDVENRFDDQIAGNTDIDEVIDARRPEGGESYPTLRKRLDDEHKEVTTQLAQIAHNAKQWGLKSGVENRTNNVIKMQELVDYVYSEGGGTILVPVGEYYFDDKIIWKPNVSLVGNGIDVTVLKTYSESTVEPFPLIEQLDKESFTITNATFSNLTIDGSELITYPSAFAKGIYIQNMDNCVVRDVKFYGTGSTALGIDYLKDCAIDNVIAVNCGRLYPEHKHGCAGIGIGTGYLPLENLTITNCKVHNSGNWGIFIENQSWYELAGDGYQPRGITISNNIVTGGKNNGIGVRGGDDIIVSNNTTYENENSGIFVDTKSSRVSIHGNISVENGIDGITVIAGDMRDFFILDNMTFDNGRNGISLGHLAASGNGLEIRDFVVNNNIIKNNKRNGIEVYYTTKRTVGVSINDNKLTHNGQNGIKISGEIFDLSITGNQIYDNGKDSVEGERNGILITGDLTYGSIRENKIYSRERTQLNGIVLFNETPKKMTNVVIDNNTLIKHPNSNGYTNFQSIDSIVEFYDTILPTILKGQLRFNGGYAIFPSDMKLLSSPGTATVVEFKLSELKEATLFSKRRASSLNYGKGYAFKINSQGKLVVEYNVSESDSLENSVTFENYTLAINVKYSLKIERKSDGLHIYVNDTELTTSVDTTGLVNLLTGTDYQSPLLFGADTTKLGIQAYFRGVVYRIYRQSEYEHVFGNYGGRELIDTSGGFNGFARGLVTQESVQ